MASRRGKSTASRHEPRRSLKPPVVLDAPEDIVEAIEWRLKLLQAEPVHPVFQMSPQEMRRRIRELVRSVRGRGKDADADLVELCRLDPRFLASDLVIAKVLDWKLRVIFWAIRMPGSRKSDPATRSLSPAAVRAFKRLGQAENSLEALGEAVSFRTGRSIDGYRLRHGIRRAFDFYLSLFTHIRAALAGKGFTDENVRRACELHGLDEVVVRKIHSEPRLEGLIDAVLASEHGVSASRIRALRTNRAKSKRVK